MGFLSFIPIYRFSDPENNIRNNLQNKKKLFIILIILIIIFSSIYGVKLFYSFFKGDTKTFLPYFLLLSVIIPIYRAIIEIKKNFLPKFSSFISTGI